MTVYRRAGCSVSGVFVFKQKTAYEVRISDWSSDVCSSDLHDLMISADNKGWASLRFEKLMGTQYAADTGGAPDGRDNFVAAFAQTDEGDSEIGRASCRERVCQHV